MPGRCLTKCLIEKKRRRRALLLINWVNAPAPRLPKSSLVTNVFNMFLDPPTIIILLLSVELSLFSRNIVNCRTFLCGWTTFWNQHHQTNIYQIFFLCKSNITCFSKSQSFSVLLMKSQSRDAFSSVELVLTNPKVALAAKHLNVKLDWFNYTCKC